MSGLGSFLLFAAVFFLMMRFGCGAHAGHGGHSGHQGGAGPSAGSDVDPVCGMQVPPDSGYSRRYRGTEFRFCTRSCLDKFDANPQQYLAGAQQNSSHGSRNS